jgi:hypothetical protein
MIILEPPSPDYKRWCDLVLLTLCRYALDEHVLSDVADPSIYWARLESIMVTWILGTLSLELHEIIRELIETARQVWLTIEAQFLDNSESCDLQLDTRFRAFKQGDLSVSYYCRWVKGMADDLHALGETVTDHHLILNLLQCLNKRFDHMKIFIKRSQPFPCFHTIRNNLELKGIELDHSVAQGQAFAFYSAPSGGKRPPQQQLPTRPPQQLLLCPPAAPPPPAPNTNNSGKARGRGRGRGRGKARTIAPAAPAPTAVIIVGVSRHGPPSTIPGPAPFRCGQGCIRHSSSWHFHHNMPYSLHQHTTMCRRLGSSWSVLS